MALGDTAVDPTTSTTVTLMDAGAPGAPISVVTKMGLLPIDEPA